MFFPAEIALQPRPLVEIERDAFVVVIGEIRQHQLRGLVERQQPLLRGGDRGAVGRVQMHDAAGVLADLVHRRMDGEAGGIDGVGGLPDLLALEIDFDQARRRDLLEHQAVGVDEEVMLRAGDARGDVGEDEIVPAVKRHEAVAGGEMDPDVGFRGGGGVGVGVHGVLPVLRDCAAKRRARQEGVALDGGQRRARPATQASRMSYRHTDRPVPAIRAVQPIRRIWPVGMFLATPVAKASVAKARAFYARRLRKWAKDKAPEAED